MILWEYLKKQIMKYPEQTVCENDAFMTYGELVIYAEKFAERLKGIKCCAILCSFEMLNALALLACFAADVTAVPLSQRYGELHCNKILDYVRPDAVITDIDGNLEIINLSDAEYKEPEDKPALIMCTSGTTGTPKGAMLSCKNIITNVKDIAEYFAIGRDDTILISRPLYHCAVLTGEFLTALVKGVKVRFFSGIFNPSSVLKLLKEYNVTVFCGTPTLLEMMARFKRSDVEYNLKHICISGECMGSEIAKRIALAFQSTDIYHIYGLTEASPRVSYLPPKLFNKYSDCVGIPLKSVSLKIIKPDGKRAAVNEVGVLWVKGDNVMSGYYNAEEKTATVLKDGWLCTGDLALINETGLLKIKGRNDDLIIKAGMNIYPQEIENAVKRDPRVKDVFVYGESDEKFGTKIVMNIVGDFSAAEEVKKLCAESLPLYQVPNKINLVNELPKNGSGKIIRRC